MEKEKYSVNESRDYPAINWENSVSLREGKNNL